MEIEGTCRPRIAPDVAWLEADDEIVAMDAGGIEVHLLSGTSALVWQLIDGEVDLDQLAAELAAAFEADVTTVLRDLFDFTDRMLTARLIEVVGQGDEVLSTGEAARDHD